jgi:hypothetical protein
MPLVKARKRVSEKQKQLSNGNRKILLIQTHQNWEMRGEKVVCVRPESFHSKAKPQQQSQLGKSYVAFSLNTYYKF